MNNTVVQMCLTANAVPHEFNSRKINFSNQRNVFVIVLIHNEFEELPFVRTCFRT